MSEKFMSDEQHILAALEASFAVAEALSKIENPILARRARAVMKQQMISDERLVALWESFGEPLQVGDRVLAPAHFSDGSGWKTGHDLPLKEFRVRSTMLFGKYTQLETLDGEVCGLAFSRADLQKVNA